MCAKCMLVCCVKLLLVLFILSCVKTNAVVILKDIQWTVRNSNGFSILPIVEKSLSEVTVQRPAHQVTQYQYKLSYTTTQYPYKVSSAISIPARVPGGIYTDLERAGVIGDILYRFNDVLTRWVAYDNWTYEGNFNVGGELENYEVANLVLHGVDTVAYIELNGSPIGSTNNMFVRYVFDVKPHLKQGENTLKVAFVSPVKAASERSKMYFTAPDCVPDIYNGECHANQLRKMQASFGWDWGPAFPSVGLWKPVEIEFYNHAILRSVTTHIEKSGQHWFLKIKAYIEANRKLQRWRGMIEAELTVAGPEKITISKDVDAKIKYDGTVEAELNLTISENVVRLWWPNRYGDQPLYDLKISISSGNEVNFKKMQIGFRTIELVEEDASNKVGDTYAGIGKTFYFKVNGYPIFMKGSNWIPAHILPELSNDVERVDGTLEAAKDTNMNMLRVWGGGLYESDLFYERCDQLGILIWQDFLFACSLYPVDPEFIDSVRIEIDQNVKRLQYHPSIAVWAGNNENEAALRSNWYNDFSQFERYKKEYIKLYVDVIKPIVNDLDPNRRYLISSPSNGIESEMEGYIAKNPYDPHYGDTHYYNYGSDNWDPNIFPKTRFASEYGFLSLPTLLTMESATNVSYDYSIDSTYSAHRQHSAYGYENIENQIKMHLKLNKNNDSENADYEYFKKYVFYSQIIQAMAIKTETEYYRQCQEEWYTMGALYWQLNDVWQAPSWSSMDFQRRWKILQYYAMVFFAPVLVSPRLLKTGDVDVYLLNDRFVPIEEAHIRVDYYNWSSLHPISTRWFSSRADALSAMKQNISLDFWNYPNKKEVFLKFSLEVEGVGPTPDNYVFPVPLKAIEGLKNPKIEISVSSAPYPPPNSYKFWIDIKVDNVVLFLWLETPPILHSYFEDNGFIVTTPNIRTAYVSTVKVNPAEVKAMITYQYYYE